jgi:hypothetical protein
MIRDEEYKVENKAQVVGSGNARSLKDALVKLTKVRGGSEARGRALSAYPKRDTRAQIHSIKRVC